MGNMAKYLSMYKFFYIFKPVIWQKAIAKKRYKAVKLMYITRLIVLEEGSVMYFHQVNKSYLTPEQL